MINDNRSHSWAERKSNGNCRMHANRAEAAIWPISLEQVEAVVSAHLGPGRVSGNAQAPSFSRHISMYLAKHVAGWSLPAIGRFYNRRHHTTVPYAVSKAERLRRQDESVDSLIDLLTETLRWGRDDGKRLPASGPSSPLIDAIATRVIEKLSGGDPLGGPGTAFSAA